MAKNKDKKVKKDKSKKADKSKKSDKSEKKTQSSKVDSKAKKVVNVFTAIGLEPKHRAVPFQLTRHYDEVTVVRNKQQFPYIAEVILDSTFCAIVQHKGSTSFYSKTGNKLQALEVLGKAFKVEADGVYLAELYVDPAITTNAKLNAIVSPFRVNKLTAPQQEAIDDKAMLILNDYITIEEFTKGKGEAPYSKRLKTLRKLTKKIVKAKNSNFAYPITDECNSEDGLRAVNESTIALGYKGINIRGADNPYVCGHQNFHYMQMVEGTTFNLLCVGYEASKAGDKVGTLSFKYDGKDVKAALDHTYSDKASAKMLATLQSEPKKDGKKVKKGKKVKATGSPIGFVWKVTALEVNSRGVMKVPTVGKFTKDKADF
jgi:hypothetical protein